MSDGGVAADDGLSRSAFSNGASCGATGTSMPPPITVASQTTFCGTSSYGGGCGPGNICVPKAPAHCTLATTPGTQACPPGYPTSTGAWSTYSDGRSCGGSCTCGPPTSGGCLGVEMHTSATCSDPSPVLVNNTIKDCSDVTPYGPYYSARISYAPVVCGAADAGPVQGSVTITPQTLCCK
jgi:hypothetical protein